MSSNILMYFQRPLSFILQRSAQCQVAESDVWNFRRQQYSTLYYRKPIKVIPAAKDRGRMLLQDYVAETEESVDLNSLKEQKAINKITESNPERVAKELSNLADQRRINGYFNTGSEFVAMKDDIPKQSLHNSVRPKFSHGDKELDNAVKQLRPGLLKDAFGIYKTLLAHCQTKKLRRKHDVVCLEGTKLIQEALTIGLKPLAVYTSRNKLLLDIMPKQMTLEEKLHEAQSLKAFKLSMKSLKAWSSVVTNQGVLAVCRLSEVSMAPALKIDSQPVTPVTVLIDSVRVPGNVGAILRSVAAIGAHNVVLTKGCCDPFESKTMRAGCGAHFGLKINHSVPWNSVYDYLPSSPRVFLADICNADLEPSEVAENLLNDVGECGKFCDASDESTSNFNYEFGKDSRNLKKEIETDGADEEIIDSTYEDPQTVSSYCNAEYPVKIFNEVNYFGDRLEDSANVVLVIGGETGVTNFAKKFVADNRGQQVSIPMCGHVDSLNTSVAAALILYEMMTQYQKLGIPRR